MRIAAKEEAPHFASWLVVSPCRGRGCRSTDSASLRIRQAATQVFIQEAIAPAASRHLLHVLPRRRSQ
ncbi:hypothetical protein JG688_00014798 [Phytophthora aleatoria]|uniref:Uncharacterized protein n=1 Tax=Phytophthora aleatoria TaxID=2496075 RepID=A0A8J5LXB5_9STRA|nr:hypothetical protein JG688_00014798 [Phytophthora aleatoria]